MQRSLETILRCLLGASALVTALFVISAIVGHKMLVPGAMTLIFRTSLVTMFVSMALFILVRVAAQTTARSSGETSDESVRLRAEDWHSPAFLGVALILLSIAVVVVGAYLSTFFPFISMSFGSWVSAIALLAGLYFIGQALLVLIRMRK
jgi:hypothetical protein